MALPVILIDSATGSDTAASGAGPATALTGSSASTDGTGLVVTLDGSPDLSGVATDGSHAIYLADTTAGARNFGKITAKDNAAKTVTVANAFGLSLTGKSWAIGGKRASLLGSNSIKLIENNSAAGDAMPGWVMEFQSAHAETKSATVNMRRSGDTTDGPITIRGASGATTLPVITFANNSTAFNGIAGVDAWAVQDFEIRNSNVSKTASTAIVLNNGCNNWTIKRMKVCHATDKFWRAFATSSTVTPCYIEENTFANCAGDGISLSASNFAITGNDIYGNGGNGITTANGANATVLFNNITGNTGDGINIANGTFHIVHNTIANNGSDGIENVSTSFGLSSSTWFGVCENNQITGNGGYGIYFSGAGAAALNVGQNIRIRGNNIWNNTSGTCNISGVSTEETTLDPQYTNAGSRDFSIGTNTSDKAYPQGGSQYIGTYSSTYSYVDPGAAQRRAAASRHPGMNGGFNG